MSETIYLGSGKTYTSKYGEFFNVTLNLDKIKERKKDYYYNRGGKQVKKEYELKNKDIKKTDNIFIIGFFCGVGGIRTLVQTRKS